MIPHENTATFQQNDAIEERGVFVNTPSTKYEGVENFEHYFLQYSTRVSG